MPVQKDTTELPEDKSLRMDYSPFLFQISDPWLGSLAYNFMVDLFERTPRQSPLAYRIGWALQEKKSKYFDDKAIPLYPAFLTEAQQAKSKTFPENLTASEGTQYFINMTNDIKRLNRIERERRNAADRHRREYQKLKDSGTTEFPASLINAMEEDKKFKARKKKDDRYKAAPNANERDAGAHIFDWLHIKVHFAEKSADCASRSSLETRPASYTNIMMLSDRFGFDETQKKILILLVCRKQVEALGTFLTSIAGTNTEFDNELMARMVGISKKDFLDEFRPTAPLVRTGLALIESGKIPSLNEEMYKRLDRPGLSFDQLVEDIIGPPRAATLELGNYPHLSKELGYAVKLLDTVLKSDTPLKGINILLYGPPGTGKTELAPVIAQALGRKIRLPGESSKDGTKAMSRGERMASILLAQSVDSSDLLGFDEMEDVLPSNADADSKDTSSGKVFLNRLLEENKRPVIWIMNHPDLLSEAVLRRFTYSVRVPRPPMPVRKSMYKSISTKMGEALSDEECEVLAREFKVSPAYIATALRFERGVSGKKNSIDIDLIRHNIRSAALLTQGSKYAFDEDIAGNAVFNPGVINPDQNLHQLTAKVCELSSPRFTMVLYGPSGTGKSAYLRYMAREMGLEVLFKRYSDLGSPYVDEMEIKTREAFDEAEAANAFLIIDEADSLMQDRRLAERSWEVTRVNEFLTCMERARTPVGLTTNLIDQIDPAMLRRFTFKVKFDHMLPEQAAQCFELFFKQKPPEDILQINNLTPGDFKNVKDKTDILGMPGPDGLLEMLEMELKLKEGKGRQMGFSTPSRPEIVSPQLREAAKRKPGH